MADITPIAATSQVTSLQPSNAPLSINVSLVDVPEQLSNLTRFIEISGTLSEIQNPNTVLMNTALGSLMLMLPQLAEIEKQDLIQKLIAALNDKKTLTAFLQPGTPPTQGVLFISSPSQNTIDQTPSLLSLPEISSPSQAIQELLREGNTLTVIVLPPPANIDLMSRTLPSYGTSLEQSSPDQTIPTNNTTTDASAGPSNSTSDISGLRSSTLPSASFTPISSLILANEVTNRSLPSTSSSVLVPPSFVENLPPVTTVDTVISENTGQPSVPFPLAPSSQMEATQPLLPLPNSSNTVDTASSLVYGTPPTLPVSQGPDIAVNIENMSAHAETDITSWPIGKLVKLQVASLSTSSSSNEPTSNQQISATVIGTTSNGRLLLKPTDSHLTLYVRENVWAPIGSQIMLNVIPTPDLTILPPSILENQFTQSVQQLLNVLNQIDPALGQQFMANTLPQPTLQFTSGLLLFFNLIGQGRFRTWLGEPITDTLLRTGHRELLDMLTEELTPAGKTAQDQVVGEWRTYSVPLQAEGLLQSFTLYVHRDHQDQSDPSYKKSLASKARIRFLVDVQMTKLGAIQLDGLVQPRKLDMIVRSENPLPSALPSELRETYIQTIEALGYTGGLGFQTGRQNWLVFEKQGTTREA